MQDFVNDIETAEPLSLLRNVYNNAHAQSMIHKMLALDIKFTLADNDIPKVSRMCELAGVQIGYPLLDHELVEFSSRLPAYLKVKRLKLRYFFKDALKDYLPAEIIKKQKHGFGLPFGRWIVSDDNLRQLALDSVNDLKKRDIFKSSFIDDILDAKLTQHPDYYGTMVWLLMILEQWYQYHGES